MGVGLGVGVGDGVAVGVGVGVAVAVATIGIGVGVGGGADLNKFKKKVSRKDKVSMVKLCQDVLQIARYRRRRKAGKVWRICTAQTRPPDYLEKIIGIG